MAARELQMSDETTNQQVRSNDLLGVLALPEHIGIEQGPDDCPKLTLSGTVVATFPAGSWREVANALCSIVGPSLDKIERLQIERDNAQLLVSEGNVAIVELGDNVDELEVEIERLRGLIAEQRATIGALMLGCDDGTTPVLIRMARQDTEIERLNAVIATLGDMAKQSHYYCEDAWYSCPKAEDGCANEGNGDECNCGADDHNKAVDVLLTDKLLNITPDVKGFVNIDDIVAVLESEPGGKEAMTEARISFLRFGVEYLLAENRSLRLKLGEGLEDRSHEIQFADGLDD